MQLKGEVPEAELRAIEEDVTGKVRVVDFVDRSPFIYMSHSRQIMLASWRGTRFEVTQVLREVCYLMIQTLDFNLTSLHSFRSLIMS